MVMMACGLFFGHDQDIWERLGQAAGDQRIGGFIGLGHRTAISLEPCLVIISLIDLHYHRTSLERNCAKCCLDRLWVRFGHGALLDRLRVARGLRQRLSFDWDRKASRAQSGPAGRNAPCVYSSPR
jgi:hypothetical protein